MCLISTAGHILHISEIKSADMGSDWPSSMDHRGSSAMKWQKLGRIFDPTEHTLANNCRQFAQSPQCLLLDDFVRIYFSTREIDKRNGKYLSHVAFVDVRKNMRDVIRVSDKT
jgi:hypothetical protein